MLAIVLSCDKYSQIAYHMIHTYQILWPSNKFVFRIPWNEIQSKYLLDNYTNKIQLIKTPLEFKKTIEYLIQDLDDNEWIYWCPDDIYLTKINELEANLVHGFVENIKDNNIYGITFGYVLQVPKFLDKTNIIQYKKLNFIKRTQLDHQWFHQYWRVKVLRKMFDCLGEPEKYKAKQMDYMLAPDNPFWKFVDTGKFYTIDHNIAEWNESTFRGCISIGTVNSFKSYNIPLPPMEITDRIRFIG